MPATPLEPGDPSELGRFTLLGRLGTGGQGVVYLGRGTGPREERVAVKALKSSADTMVMQRLARELEAVHQVQPFVTAQVIEAGTAGDVRYVVTEFVEGPNLSDRVKTGGPLPEGDLRRLAVGTATALTAIHGAGVVHRDFKPANVLLGPDGPRVVDFGIARLIDAATITSGIIGTPAYLAPEQLSEGHPTSSVDIFSWGVTITFAATGRPAFGADSVPAVMHRILTDQPDLGGLPESLRPVVEACLDKDPERRPSARDLLLRLVDPSIARPSDLARPAAPAQAATPAAPGQAATPAAPAQAATPGHLATPAWAAPSPGTVPGPVPGTVPGTEPAVTPVPGRTPPLGHRPPRRGTRRLVAAGAAAVIVVAGGIVGLILSLGSPAKPKPTPTGTGTSHPTNTAGGIPAAFAGTWSGTAKQAAPGVPVRFSNTMTITLVAGERSAHERDTSPLGDDCEDDIALRSATPTVLTFVEPTRAGVCVGGDVTITQAGTGIRYQWSGGGETNTGILTRT